jgi:hypothetical protein
MALRLQMLSSGIKYLRRVGPEQGLDDEAMRMVLSAHKQLTGMRRLLETLQTNDDIGFILAIEELEKLRMNQL